MVTKEIIESLLYVAESQYAMRQNLRICHVLNDSDRNWEPIEHNEFHFINNFKNPYFLMVVDKQVHVYLIGEKDKGKTYNILNIEGNNTELFTLAKTGLIKEITDTLKESQEQFLPSPLSQRILYINKIRKPVYDELTYHQNTEIYIFNRTDKNDKILRKSKWTLGTDIYSAALPEYTTSVNEILKECLKEMEEDLENNVEVLTTI